MYAILDIVTHHELPSLKLTCSLVPSLKTVISLAAILGYLDAKAGIAHDLRLLSGIRVASTSVSREEQRGRLNIFLTLEDKATAPATRDHTFLIFEGRRWTYNQAYDIILRYGAWLKDRHGIKQDEMVAIDFINKPTFLWMFLGLWSIGAKAAFVNYNLSGNALVHAVKTSKARLLIVDVEVSQKVLTGEEGEKTKDRLIHDEIEEDAGFTEREVFVFDEGVEKVVDTWTGRREPTEVIGKRKIGEMGVLIYTRYVFVIPSIAYVPSSG